MSYYGQDPRVLPTPLDTLSEEMKEQLTQLGELVSEQVSLDPEFDEIEVVEDVSVQPAHPGFLRQVQHQLLDADANKTITPGEIRVFAMGLISGLVLSRLLR